MAEEGGPLESMLEPGTLVIDSYAAIVSSLRCHLLKSVSSETTTSSQSNSAKYSVLVMGHGGQDTCLSFAVIEAVAFEPGLVDVVDVHVLTCSWDDDVWVLHLAVAFSKEPAHLDKRSTT